MHNSMHNALSSETKVNDLDFDLYAKIAFWTLLPPGAYSISFKNTSALCSFKALASFRDF